MSAICRAWDPTGAELRLGELRRANPPDPLRRADGLADQVSSRSGAEVGPAPAVPAARPAAWTDGGGGGTDGKAPVREESGAVSRAAADPVAAAATTTNPAASGLRRRRRARAWRRVAAGFDCSLDCPLACSLACSPDCCSIATSIGAPEVSSRASDVGERSSLTATRRLLRTQSAQLITQCSRTAACRSLHGSHTAPSARHHRRTSGSRTRASPSSSMDAVISPAAASTSSRACPMATDR